MQAVVALAARGVGHGEPAGRCWRQPCYAWVMRADGQQSGASGGTGEVAHGPRVDRLARKARHARDGYRQAMGEPEYRSGVLARLAPELGEGPTDLWTAISWTWSVCLGGSAPPDGACAADVVAAAAVLRVWFESDEPLAVLQSQWRERCGDRLALGSTLRSHPFPDVYTWSFRVR